MRPTAPWSLLLLLLGAGCGASTPVTPPSAPSSSGASASETPAKAANAADASALAMGVNRLGIGIYGKLREAPGNLVFSPASVAMALTMTWGGARGETAAQMARVLGLEGDPDRVLGAAGALLARWNDPSRGTYTLRVANRLFGERSYAFLPDFLALTERSFGAPLEAVDFRNDAEGARQRVNGWVDQQTASRIRDLIPPRGVDDQTRLALVNAIYLLADWEQPFTVNATSERAFWVDGVTEARVPTMHQVESFRLSRADGVSALELPYAGGELSMVLVLPDARDGLPALEARLDEARLRAWLETGTYERVRVWLPKFTVDPAGSTPLAELLIGLGMPLAFDRARADFRGIADPPDPADRLVISQVFHKAFIKVFEKGTEAAAATAVVMARAGSAPPAQPPVEFRADHPFLFFLRDRASGMVLFAGRVVDPR